MVRSSSTPRAARPHGQARRSRSHALPRARRRSRRSSPEPAARAFVVSPPAAAARADVEVTDLVRVSASQLAIALGLPEARRAGADRARRADRLPRSNTASRYRAARDGHAIEWYGRASDSIYSSTRAYTIAKRLRPRHAAGHVTARTSAWALRSSSIWFMRSRTRSPGRSSRPTRPRTTGSGRCSSSSAADSAHDLTAHAARRCGRAAERVGHRSPVRRDDGRRSTRTSGRRSLNGVSLGTAVVRRPRSVRAPTPSPKACCVERRTRCASSATR